MLELAWPTKFYLSPMQTLTSVGSPFLVIPTHPTYSIILKCALHSLSKNAFPTLFYYSSIVPGFPESRVQWQCLPTHFCRLQNSPAKQALLFPHSKWELQGQKGGCLTVNRWQSWLKQGLKTLRPKLGKTIYDSVEGYRLGNLGSNPGSITALLSNAEYVTWPLWSSTSSCIKYRQ